MDAYPQWPNLAAMLFDRARQWNERPMLRAYRSGAWQGWTWGRFARQAAAAARALGAAGVKPGDRVLIAAENGPEYPIAEAALMAIGAVPVPAYTTNTPADHAHILRNAGIRAAIASSRLLAERVIAGAALAAPLDLCIAVEPAPAPRQTRLLDWSLLIADEKDPSDIAASAARITPDSLACLIYTSGTGGTPKGVMLPHRAILSNCRGCAALVRSLDLMGGVYLSVLPLSHSYEHTVGQFFLSSIGVEVVYGRGIEHLAADLLTVRPTLITVVPRVLEVFRARILAQMARAPRLQRALFSRALANGLARIHQRPLSPLEKLAEPILDRLVRKKVQARFGGNLRALVSGGARLDPEVGRFFIALGVPVMQGYGQTEAGPVVSATPPGSTRIETVGPPLEGVSLRIADDGEVLVQGDLVMLGYWNEPRYTETTLAGGWLHTGDIGVVDPDGYLRITDRKKDIIVLSGGDNISPARIEGMLMSETEILQAVVSGDGRPYLSALLVPAEGADAAAVGEAVRRVNSRLAVIERVRHHKLVPAFTLENGLLTPTQKIRRQMVLSAHGGALREPG
ncbi:MAG: AMP-dependent synthetase/ligase [Rhodospirillales bacterium]|nr:AMP-dependent synthetase/ligase [Rhodospirillales bacterium]